VFIMHKNCA